MATSSLLFSFFLEREWTEAFGEKTPGYYARPDRS